MHHLAALVLALMLGFTSRGPSLSRLEVPAGTAGARFEPCWSGGYDRLGDEHRFPCRAYVPSEAPRGAWVVIEPDDARAERLRPAADELAATAERELALWSGGDVHEFAIALTTAAGWSTGFREDIEDGRARGPDGEVCLADATLETVRKYSDADVAALPKGELAQAVVGRSPLALRRCFTVLARAFAHSHAQAHWRCPVRRTHQSLMRSTFALYGTGNFCSTPAGWVARYHFNPERMRERTFNKWLPRAEPVWPAWFQRPPALLD